MERYPYIVELSGRVHSPLHLGPPFPEDVQLLLHLLFLCQCSCCRQLARVDLEDSLLLLFASRCVQACTDVGRVLVPEGHQARGSQAGRAIELVEHLVPPLLGSVEDVALLRVIVGVDRCMESCPRRVSE